MQSSTGILPLHLTRTEKEIVRSRADYTNHPCIAFYESESTFWIGGVTSCHMNIYLPHQWWLIDMAWRVCTSVFLRHFWEKGGHGQWRVSWLGILLKPDLGQFQQGEIMGDIRGDLLGQTYCPLQTTWLRRFGSCAERDCWVTVCLSAGPGSHWQMLSAGILPGEARLRPGLRFHSSCVNCSPRRVTQICTVKLG